MVTHLLTTGDRPSCFAQNDLQFSFPRVLFIAISNPQHPHHNAHCFYHYFLGPASAHRAIQLKSQTLNLTSFGSIGYAFRCAFHDLSRFRITRLDWTTVSWIPTEANGAYLFNGSYQIVQSLFSPK